MIKLLDDRNGYLILYPARIYDQILLNDLRAWCHRHARYGLLTTELIEWLKTFIGDRTAIEIGSGSGDLAYHLGIKATDNRQQEWADVALLYKMMGQPVIRYPLIVEELDALDAIAKYDPQVVVASWVTEWIDPNVPPPPHGGSIYGVKEDQIVGSGRNYVLIGNKTVHGHKKIMDIKHEEYDFPFIKSRSASPSENRIWVWNN